MAFLLDLIRIAFQVYFWLIIIYVLMSWIPGLREGSFGELIGNIVEPYLGIFRRFIPPIGMIDISPIVAILALQFIQQGLFSLLRFLL